jgi:hypothetical protein
MQSSFPDNEENVALVTSDTTITWLAEQPGRYLLTANFLTDV